MAAIPGGVQVAGFIAPTDSGDTYPVIDPIYGIGGWREVANASEMYAISTQRRRQGMVVVTMDTMEAWQLESDLLTWSPFGGSGQGNLSRIQFTDAVSVQVSIPFSPTLTVWINDQVLTNFMYNSGGFGSSTWNGTVKLVMIETKDYTAMYDPNGQMLEVTFAVMQSGEITYGY